VKAGLRILEEWRNQGLGSSFSCWWQSSYVSMSALQPNMITR
jgi:hypothetical protein